MPKKISFVLAIIISLSLTLWFSSPAKAQLPFLQDLFIYSKIQQDVQDESLDFACITLDGRCLFKLFYTRDKLSERVSEVQERLNDIKKIYLKNDNSSLAISKQANGSLWDIYIQILDREKKIINEQEDRLLSITPSDAEPYGVTIATRADNLIEVLYEGFKTAKQERQKDFLIHQGIIAVITGLAMVLTSLAISIWIKRSRQLKNELTPSDSIKSLPISSQLNQRQRWNLKEVQYRLLQIVQIFIWGKGTLFILDLFPDTRVGKYLIITGIRIPLFILVVGLLTYLVIRLSYALIARVISVFFAGTYILNRRASHRLQLRVTTILKTAKSIVTIICSIVGFLIACSVAGVNIGPLLAGAGIVGLAVSFASQNLIKDALNGLFILIEDQYAVGDVIKVGEVDGLVENINLRITQLRDAAGRLITIPNSEVRIVANLSSQWSRADLNIPIAYHTDIDKALHLIDEVAQEMSKEAFWQHKILESPQVLGVENFEAQGIIIKVWIKTEPLKQWEVSREFRRRVLVAFENKNIPISPPQQQIWFNQDSEESTMNN
jgi:small conductance mechanosensitive channel